MSRVFNALKSISDANPESVASAVPSSPASTTKESADANIDFSQVPRIRHAIPQHSRVLTWDGFQDPARERFRFLAHRLRSLRRSRPLSSVLITSVAPRDGKTLITVNLATILATNSRVLLIDADMRQPSIGSVLGLEPLPGLADCLEESSVLRDAVVFLEAENMYYLAAGRPTQNPAELLQRPTASRLIKQAAAHFDWVFFDSPPLSLFADSHALAASVDSALLVVRSGVTTKAELEQGISALETTFVAGVVLNGFDHPQQGYYYSHSGYGPRRESLSSR